MENNNYSFKREVSQLKNPIAHLFSCLGFAISFMGSAMCGISLAIGPEDLKTSIIFLVVCLVIFGVSLFGMIKIKSRTILEFINTDGKIKRKCGKWN